MEAYTKPHHVRIVQVHYVALIIFSTLLVSGCSKPIKEAIVGKWSQGPSDYFEFFHDNTFIVFSSGEQGSGRWIEVSDDRIKADLDDRTIFFEDIKISGNQITWVTNLNGTRRPPATLKRL